MAHLKNSVPQEIITLLEELCKQIAESNPITDPKSTKSPFSKSKSKERGGQSKRKATSRTTRAQKPRKKQAMDTSGHTDDGGDNAACQKEVDAHLFADDMAQLKDKNYVGPPPAFQGTITATDIKTNESHKMEVVGSLSQALSSIDAGSKGTYKGLDDAGKVDLLREAIRFYEELHNQGADTIFPPGTKVECADWGMFWPGKVVSSFVDGADQLFYKIKFEKNNDSAFHHFHRVRAAPKVQVQIPPTVNNNAQKMKMFNKLKFMTTKKEGSPAGFECQVEIPTGEYKGKVMNCLIEMVDIPTKKITLYDLQSKIMFRRPIWAVFKFGDLYNRKVAPSPKAFDQSGTAPFEGNGKAQAPITNVEEVTTTVTAAATAATTTTTNNKTSKKKNLASASDTESYNREQAEHWMAFAIQHAVDGILGQLVAHYDGRSGNILTEVQNIRDEVTGVQKELSLLKGATDGSNASLIDTLKGCTFTAKELTSASKRLLGEGENGGEWGVLSQRIEVLEQKLGKLDTLENNQKTISNQLHQVLSIFNNQQQVQQQQCQPFVQQQMGPPQPFYGQSSYWPQQQTQFHQPTQQQQQPQIPLITVGSEDLFDTQLNRLLTSSGAPSSQVLTEPRPQDDIMKSLTNWEESRKIPNGAVEEDSRHSHMSNADTAIDTATRVLKNVGNATSLDGSTLRRVVSFDVTTDNEQIEVTTIEETHFGSTFDEGNTSGVITDFGIIQLLQDGTGSRLVGSVLDEIPSPLDSKLSKLLGQIGIHHCRDGLLITNTISTCLRFFFNEVKCLTTALPLHLQNPVYAYDPHCPEGPLNDLIGRNSEPLKSILRYIHQKLIIVNEVLLTRCLRQALKELQKACRAHRSCKYKHTRTSSTCSSLEDFSQSGSTSSAKETQSASGPIGDKQGGKKRKKTDSGTQQPPQKKTKKKVQENQSEKTVTNESRKQHKKAPANDTVDLHTLLAKMSEEDRRKMLADMMGDNEDED